MIKRDDGGKTRNYSRRKAIKASGRFRSGQMVDQKYPLDSAIPGVTCQSRADGWRQHLICSDQYNQTDVYLSNDRPRLKQAGLLFLPAEMINAGWWNKLVKGVRNWFKRAKTGRNAGTEKLTIEKERKK